MSRRIHSADELLRQYAEVRSVLSGAKAQDLIAHRGGIAALQCATPRCQGNPRTHPKFTASSDVPRWICSVCRKAWPIEEKDLGRREFQDSVRGVVSIGEMRLRLGDLAVILNRVQKKLPWPFIAWYVHVLAPTYEATEDGPAVGLGVPLDLVPERMQQLAHAKQIDPLPFGGVTLYRVKPWINAARDETMRQVAVAGL